MSIPSRQTFMQVKQKLDYYRLPTSFPPEATNIISKLLQKIQQKTQKPSNLLKTDRTKDSISSPMLSPRKQSFSQSFQASNSKDQLKALLPAIQLKIKSLIKQNNSLHKQLIECKEHIQILRQCKQLQKKHDLLLLNGQTNKFKTYNNQSNQIYILRTGFQVLKARQIELFEELTQVKYKYNELMDLIHEDPNVQKQYIKRLIKHRKYENNHDGLERQNNNKKGSKSKQRNNILIENYYKSQTSYGVVNAGSASMNKKGSSSGNQLSQSDINRLQAQNYKLSCLNNNLKIKLENRQLQILRLQNKIQGFLKTIQVKEKNKEIERLKDQVEILLKKVEMNRWEYQNKGIENVRIEKIQKGDNKSTAQLLGNNRKISASKKNVESTNIRSPVKSPIISIKSPPKPLNKQKPNNKPSDPSQPNHQAKNHKNSVDKPSKNPNLPSSQQNQKHHNQNNPFPINSKSPVPKSKQKPIHSSSSHQKQQKQISQLKKTNQKLKNQVSILLNELELFKKSSILKNSNFNASQQERQAGQKGVKQEEKQTIFKNQAIIKNSHPASSRNKYQENTKKNNNTVNYQALERQVQQLKEQIKQKNIQIQKIELRWKKSQEENRILIDQLEEKRVLIEQIFNGNGSKVFEGKGVKGQGKGKYEGQQFKYKNSESKDHKNTTNKQQKDYQNFKKTNLKTTNVQTTTNQLLSTTNNNLQLSKQTLVYSPAASQYNKRQLSNINSNNPRGTFSQRIQIDLKSDIQSQKKVMPYPSNIHSNISSQKHSKKSQKILHEIKQQDSLEKSHHSDQQGKSKINKSKGMNNNSIQVPIRVSIKNNQNDQVEGNVYESKMYSEKSSNKNSMQNKNSVVGNQTFGKVNYISQPSVNKKGQKQQSYQQNEEQNMEQKDGDSKNPNLLNIDESDKDSVFSMRKQIDQLKIDNRKQVKTKKKLQKMFKQSQEQRQRLQDMMYELEAKINQLENENKLFKSNGGLKFKESRGHGEENNRNSRNDNEGQAIDRKLTIKIKQQEEKIKQLEQENAQTFMQIRDKDTKIKNLQDKISSLNDKINQLTQNIKRFEQQNNFLKKQKGKLVQLGTQANKIAKTTSQLSQNNLPATNLQKLQYQQSQIQHHNQILWLKKQVPISSYSFPFFRSQHYKQKSQNTLKPQTNSTTISVCIGRRNRNCRLRD